MHILRPDQHNFVKTRRWVKYEGDLKLPNWNSIWCDLGRFFRLSKVASCCSCLVLNCGISLFCLQSLSKPTFPSWKVLILCVFACWYAVLAMVCNTSKTSRLQPILFLSVCLLSNCCSPRFPFEAPRSPSHLFRLLVRWLVIRVNLEAAGRALWTFLQYKVFPYFLTSSSL